jgi:hypothetical protein
MNSGIKPYSKHHHGTPPRDRTPRLALGATLVFIAVVAVACGDIGRSTGPLSAFSPYTLKGVQNYDSAPAPLELKNAAHARWTASGSAARLAARPLMSASGSEASGMVVTQIPFAPEAGPFLPIRGCNGECVLGEPDEFGDPKYDASGTPIGFPIGFNFTFFGNTYDRFFWSTNGFVTFNAGQYDGCCEGYVIPSPDLGWDGSTEFAVNNLIALAWADLQPLAGEVGYATRGTAPNRRLIVNLNNVQGYLDPSWGIPSDFSVTAQLILHETTNVIEIHTTSMVQSAFMRVTQGVENADGTEALFIEGRVNDFFSLTNDAVRFAPPAGANRAPTVEAGGNAGGPPFDHYAGTEGSPISFKASGSDADNDPLSFSWDFNGDGVEDRSGAEVSYTYPDNGAFEARVTVSDNHGHSAAARIDVIVANVNPTAVLNGPDVVEEGSSIVLSASNAADPSEADQAGLEFAFDCGAGAGFGAFSAVSSVSCPTVDNEKRTVAMKVRDKNAGESEAYTKVVDVRNVAPVVNAGETVSVLSGQVVSLAGRFSDAGVNDRMWKYTWSNNGQAIAVNHQLRSGGTTPDQGAVAGEYRACGVGPQVITLSVMDKDNDQGAATVTINIAARQASMRVKPNVVAIRSIDRDEDTDSDDEDRYSDDHGRMVTVYVYSTPEFDATSIDPSSVRLTNGSGKGTPLAKKRKRKNDEWEIRVKHLNNDRLRDVKLSFSRSALIANGDLTPSTTSFSVVAKAGSCAYIAATAPVWVKTW